MALALAEPDGDGHAAVACVLEGLDLAEADRHVEAVAEPDVDLGSSGAKLRGGIEGVTGEVAELVGAQAKAMFWHGKGAKEGAVIIPA